MVAAILIAGFQFVTTTGGAAEALPTTPAHPSGFAERIEPILQDHCCGCHSSGTAEGGFSFDDLARFDANEDDRRKWWTVLRKLRAGTMPPAGEPAPNSEQKASINQWIKSEIFDANDQHPDPGRVTLRRLNRVEYQNTVSELLGIDYDTKANFPPDDTGHGFDNMGDVLTISPLLLEKYLDAARDIVHQAVPLVSGVPKKRYISGGFLDSGEEKWNALEMSYKVAKTVGRPIDIELPGDYIVELSVQATEDYIEDKFDYNKCRLVFRLDDEIVSEQDFSRQSWTSYDFKFDRKWDAGRHNVSLELIPLTPDEPSVRSLNIEFKSVTLFGPDNPVHFDRPERYERFFPRGPASDDEAQRRQYAREIIEPFATRAFRRPVDQSTVDKLVGLAEHRYREGGKTFEAGVADAMIAILASPRFLFREEAVLPAGDAPFALIDEFSLASRLSYFLWSSMPDDELMKLASEGELRNRLGAQVNRMLADDRSKQFFENFVGQWLRSRDIETVVINPSAVLDRERVTTEREELLRNQYRNFRGRSDDELTDEQKQMRDEARELRKRREQLIKDASPDSKAKRAMRLETEMVFEHLLRENRPLYELIDSNYSFLNESLAKYYGIEGVKGREMRKVELSPDNLRGGVLTQSTFLSITSNPDRTSPVKRGKFILENLLGTPTAAPPPNIPALEESEKGSDGRKLSLRESLEIHRENALCASCHNSMDPLGLALENFNALGHFRQREASGPINPNGKLISGEEFTSVKELKTVLATHHRREIYACVTEKLLTYAIGRGMDYFDVETVDNIVDQLEAQDGRAGGLILAIVESAPFQKSRTTELNE